MAGQVSEMQQPIPPAAQAAGDPSGAAPINRLVGVRRLSWYTRAKFRFVREFLGLWLRLFGLTGLYWFGSTFATLEFLIDGGRRKRYRKVLRKIVPEKRSGRELRAITRSYFRRARCDKIFYLIYDKIPRHKLISRIRFHGRERLEAGLARGRGVYLAMSHHGSHHIIGQLLSLLGYRLTGIRDGNEGAMRSYFQLTVLPRLPEGALAQMLFAGDFPREIFRCFQENRLVISALDISRARGRKLKTCEVQFFGQTREFLTGTMQIAMRCGSTVVPTFLVSRPNYYYRIVIEEPLFTPADAGTNGSQPDLAAAMQGYADAIAAHIRDCPDHLSRV